MTYSNTYSGSLGTQRFMEELIKEAAGPVQYGPNLLQGPPGPSMGSGVPQQPSAGLLRKLDSQIKPPVKDIPQTVNNSVYGLPPLPSVGGSVYKGTVGNSVYNPGSVSSSVYGGGELDEKTKQEAANKLMGSMGWLKDKDSIADKLRSGPGAGTVSVSNAVYGNSVSSSVYGDGGGVPQLPAPPANVPLGPGGMLRSDAANGAALLKGIGRVPGSSAPANALIGNKMDQTMTNVKTIQTKGENSNPQAGNLRAADNEILTKARADEAATEALKNRPYSQLLKERVQGIGSSLMNHGEALKGKLEGHIGEWGVAAKGMKDSAQQMAMDNPLAAAGIVGAAGLTGAALLGRGAARAMRKGRGIPREVMAAITAEVMDELIKEASYYNY